MSSDQSAGADDILRQIKDQDLRFLRLWFTDVSGQLKSFSVNSSELERAIESGIPFDGSSITGFNAVEESDMVAVPDLSTFATIPWRPTDQGVGRIICDVRTPEGRAYEGDPRHVLRRAITRMHDMGFSDLLVAPELEYYLFAGSEGTEVLDQGGYFDLTTLDAGSDVRRGTVIALEQLGVEVATSHHESGPSQHEVAMRPASALKAADDCMTARITVKEIAMEHGWHATFMPKPLAEANGSGMHTNLTLLRDGENALVDNAGSLTETGRAFVAGQLRHAREMSSVFAQWVNSYKRLVPGFEAPVYVAWSKRNRSALLRVAGAEGNGTIELRCPDPACNPYLAFAAMLQAGLEGIEQGYELPEAMDRNLYHLGAGERRRLGVEPLPESLGDAIELTADSELMLRTFGEHMLDRFVELKRREWREYRVQVTDWEHQRYLPVL
ncbi:MAG TPA: type I glutamate--ammonia ligase [Baekduia sp.]|nr:type I glutamate--ammonia ligase [Baekduia sp.]